MARAAVASFVLLLVALALPAACAGYDRYFARYSCGGQDLLDNLRGRTSLHVLGYGCLPRGKKRVECVVAVLGYEDAFQLEFKCKGKGRKASWKLRSGSLPQSQTRRARSVSYVFDEDADLASVAKDASSRAAAEASVMQQLQTAANLPTGAIDEVSIEPADAALNVVFARAYDKAQALAAGGSVTVDTASGTSHVNTRVVNLAAEA